jgi:DNA-binding transcriptional regulator YdaS (Cro superfamily)
MPVMELHDWLKQEHGRQAALARHLGIKPPQVADWISGDKPVPVVHMAAIEAFTNGAVTRREMRPDDFAHIWPELADTTATDLVRSIKASMQQTPTVEV